MCAWHKYFPWSPKTAFAHQYLQECCSRGKTVLSLLCWFLPFDKKNERYKWWKSILFRLQRLSSINFPTWNGKFCGGEFRCALLKQKPSWSTSHPRRCLSIVLFSWFIYFLSNQVRNINNVYNLECLCLEDSTYSLVPIRRHVPINRHASRH